jgi:hypothetical protein
MRTPEFWEKKDICAFLDALGPDLCSYAKHTTMGYGKSGVGDITACVSGAYWNIEAKRPGAKPTAIQIRRMNETKRAGGHAVAGTAEVVIQTLRAWLKVRGIET